MVLHHAARKAVGFSRNFPGRALWLGRIRQAFSLALCLAGAVVFLLGFWPTLREMFSEGRGLGYVALPAPPLQRRMLGSAWAALLFASVPLPCSVLKREMWLQVVALALGTAGLGPRRLAGA